MSTFNTRHTFCRWFRKVTSSSSDDGTSGPPNRHRADSLVFTAAKGCSSAVPGVAQPERSTPSGARATHKKKLQTYQLGVSYTSHLPCPAGKHPAGACLRPLSTAGATAKRAEQGQAARAKKTRPACPSCHHSLLAKPLGPATRDHAPRAMVRVHIRSSAHGFRCWACSSAGAAHATGATDRTGMSKLTRWEAAAASRGSRAQHTSTRRAHTAFVWQPSPQPRCPLPSRAAVRCGQQVLRDLAGHHCSDGQATRVPGQHHSASPTPRRLGNRFAPLAKALRRNP